MGTGTLQSWCSHNFLCHFNIYPHYGHRSKKTFILFLSVKWFEPTASLYHVNILTVIGPLWRALLSSVTHCDMSKIAEHCWCSHLCCHYTHGDSFCKEGRCPPKLERWRLFTVSQFLWGRLRHPVAITRTVTFSGCSGRCCSKCLTDHLVPILANIPYKVASIMIIVLQLTKVRHREVKCHPWGCTVSTWGSLDWNTGSNPSVNSKLYTSEPLVAINRK